MRFAEVAVDAPAGHSRTFSYSIPPAMSVRPGHLVRVPFGARTLQGIVFSLEESPQVPETRDIISVTDPEPALADVHLQLARWISEHYISSLFEAAALLLPPGGRLRSKTYLSLRSDIDDIESLSLTPFQQRVFDFIKRRRTAEQERAIKSLGEGARGAINRLVEKGAITRTFGASRPNVSRKYQESIELTATNATVIAEWLPNVEHKAPRQAAALLHLLEVRDSMPIAQARKECGASAINALLEKRWIQKKSMPIERDPLAGKRFDVSPPVALTKRQEVIASRVRASLDGDSDSPDTYLVQGVTGSGKTEVYLDAVEHCLDIGKRAIILVPEIALTHQTIERFASRFPGQVAVLHSGISPGERFDQWWKIRQGEYGVVIGSRGAVFAPMPDLGLIVIDEEHEWTYKQHDANPRYHARDVALKLAGLTGAIVVLGSASPDVASYYKGLRKEYQLLTLPDRIIPNGDGVPGAHLAPVEIVDMRKELREGNRDIFSRNLMTAMKDCLKADGQMILFLNRRGSSAYMQCRSCGYSLRCARCDISLTHHNELKRLLCHYCGYRRAIPDQCPDCLAYRLSFYGAGTQAIAEEVRRRFPDVMVLRWDRDTAGGPTAYEDILSRFSSGEAKVLVGTQMIAKGLHFPSVTLVGVVSADVGLNIPDYRAGERAFQLLCQVAGRAGRGSAGGKVIIQTFQPENYAIQAAALQDYQRFYTKEMAFRREQANPPYNKLIHLLYTHKNRALCEREAERLATHIEEERDAWGYSDIDVLGPTPAYPARLRGHYRWHLIIRGPEPRTLLDQITMPTGWIIDVDPVTLT